MATNAATPNANANAAPTTTTTTTTPAPAAAAAATTTPTTNNNATHGPRSRGYAKLADTMARTPEFAIFRKFSYLNMLNLLRLQAQLCALEESLGDIQLEDETSSNADRQDYAMDFQVMRDSESLDNLQLETLQEIGKVLSQYNTALAQYEAVTKLPAPTDINIREYRKWLLTSRRCGVNFPREHENPYTPGLTGDQISLTESNTENDPIVKLLAGPVIDCIERLRGRPKTLTLPHTELRGYDDRTLARTSTAISAVISSLLPTMTILVLYFVNRMIIRIGLVILFTALFSMALAYFTEANKVEIFSAAAAFVAVEVVFIGSTNLQTS